MKGAAVGSPLRTLPRSSAGKDHPEPSLDTSSLPPRLPLCPIPEPSHNPSTMPDPTPPARPDLPSTPRTRSKENIDPPAPFLTPPLTSSKFGWYEHRRQASSYAEQETVNGDGQHTDLATPPRCSSGFAENHGNSHGIGMQFSRLTPRSAKSTRIFINENDAASSIGGSPGPMVPRSLKYNQQAAGNANFQAPSGLTNNRQNGTSSSLARATGIFQPIRGHASQLSVQNCTEVPHFELEDDPSFWNDHNVQVLIRIRPFNDGEIAGQGYSRCLRQESPHTLTWIGLPESRFTFDHVACETITQEKLFKVAGLPMVENCMSGYNSCMFAYGQTGSGKTYTMLGDADQPGYPPSENRGMTPRIFEYLFSKIQTEENCHQHEQLHYVCKCSFLEIYNEQITDLLEPTSTNLQMHEDIKKGVYVENLMEVEVKCVQDVAVLLIQGSANRRVATTNMNQESSRSHSVFTCVIESNWKTDSVTNKRFGRLNLVDLAGSERQKSSGAEGERLKEAANINKSLSTLGLVIMILVDVAHGKQRHVPYRDSKLTFLLQDSLGGNSKTTIIANVSPSVCSAYETLSTLKFAQRAKFIRNNAVVNEDASGDVMALRMQIQQLKDELNCLRSQTMSKALSLRAIEAVPAVSSCENAPDLEVRKFSDRKIKSMETILAGALRREQAADNATKFLTAEIEQLNRLVRQREEDNQCGKMMLRFREEKIRKLKSVTDGLMSAESYLKEENNALKEEVHILRARTDRNPELTRFAMENIRLVEQLRRLQEFYEKGEREVMQEEISMLRDQLLDLLEGNATLDVDPQRQLICLTQASVTEPADTRKENELLRLEVDNCKKELQEYKSDLSTYIETNRKMFREISELKEQADRLKLLCDHQESELQILKEKDGRFETERNMYDRLNQQLADALQEADVLRNELKEVKQALAATAAYSDCIDSSDTVLAQLQMELEALNGTLEAERFSRKEAVETVGMLSKQLEESHEKERELCMQVEESFQKLEHEKAIIEAFENQHMVLSKKLEDLELKNNGLTKVMKKNEKETQLFRSQVHFLQGELQKMLEARFLAVEKNGAPTDFNLQMKLEEARTALQKAQEMNAKLKSEEASRLAIEQEHDLVRSDAETEMINTITSLQSELICLEKDAAASRKEGSMQVAQLTKELDHLQTRYTELLTENEHICKMHEIMKSDNDDKVLAFSGDAASGESKLYEYLIDGNQLLDEAALEINNFCRVPEYSCGMPYSDLNDKDDPLEVIQKHLLCAQTFIKDTEQRLRGLSEAAVVMSEHRRQEKEAIESSALGTMSILEDKIELLKTNATSCKIELQKSHKMLLAVFVLVNRLCEKSDELVESKSRMENQILEYDEENHVKQNLLRILEDKLEILTEECRSVRKDVNDKENFAHTLQEELKFLRSENLRHVKDLEVLKSEKNLLAVKADQSKLEGHRLENAISDLTSENVRLEGEVENWTQKYEELIAETKLMQMVTNEVFLSYINMIKADDECQMYEEDSCADQLLLMLVERQITESISKCESELLQNELHISQSNLRRTDEKLVELMTNSEEVALHISEYQRDVSKFKVLQNDLSRTKIMHLRSQKIGVVAFTVISWLSEKCDELAMAENMVSCLLNVVLQAGGNKKLLELSRYRDVSARGIQKKLNLLYEMQQTILEECQLLRNDNCAKEINICSLEHQVRRAAFENAQFERELELLREERVSYIGVSEELKHTAGKLKLLELKLEKAEEALSILSCENKNLIDEKALLLYEKELSQVFLESQLELFKNYPEESISTEQFAKEKLEDSMAKVETMAVTIASLECKILMSKAHFDQSQLEVRRSKEVILVAFVLVAWLMEKCDELTVAQGKSNLYNEDLQKKLANLLTEVELMAVERVELKEKIQLLQRHITSYKMRLWEAHQMAVSAFILVGSLSERTSKFLTEERYVKVADEMLQELEFKLRNSQLAYSIISCQRDEWAHEKVIMLVEFEIYKELLDSELKDIKKELQSSISCKLFAEKKLKELTTEVRTLNGEKDELEEKLKKNKSLHIYADRCVRDLQKSQKAVVAAFSALSWLYGKFDESIIVRNMMKLDLELAASAVYDKENQLVAMSEEIKCNYGLLSEMKGSLHRLQHSEKQYYEENTLLGKELHMKEGTIQDLQEQINFLTVSKTTLENDIELLKKEYQESINVIQCQLGLAEGKLKGNKLMQEQLDNLISEKARLQEEIVMLKKENEAALMETENSKEGKMFIQKRVDDLMFQKAELEMEMKLNVDKCEAYVTEARKKLNVAEENLLHKASIEEQLNAVTSQNSRLLKEINSLKQESGTLSEESEYKIRQLEENIKREKLAFRNSEQQCFVLECEIDKLAEENMEMHRNIERLRAEQLQFIADLKMKDDDMNIVRFELQNSCKIIEEVRGSHMEAVKKLQEKEMHIADFNGQVTNLDRMLSNLQEEKCRREAAIREWLDEMKKQERSLAQSSIFLSKKEQEDARLWVEEAEVLGIQFSVLQEKINKSFSWLSEKTEDDSGAIFSEGCHLIFSEVEHVVNRCKINAAAGWENAEKILDEKCVVEKELEQKDEAIRRLQESMVELKMQLDDAEVLATGDDCRHKQIELIRLQGCLEAENAELKEQMKDMIAKVNCMEVELEDRQHRMHEYQLEFFRNSSLLEQEVDRSVGSRNRELNLVIKERDELHAELVVLTERLEMAQSVADDQEAVAIEARQVAEMSKSVAKQKEDEVKLLHQSVEELESTVNALESQVGIAKMEVDRQRLMREDVELELQALQHHISNIQALSSSQFENERALVLQLLEAKKEIKDLQSEAAGKNEQIKNCKAHIADLIDAAERQTVEHNVKLRGLEVMVDQVKVVEGKSCSIPVAGKVTRARGPGSPFKCIKSGLSQQMSSELDEELCISRLRIEELEHLANERQKEIFMLNARLAEAESMTHDVIRDLLGVKLDITSYASMLKNGTSKQIVGPTPFNADIEEKEQELDRIKGQLIEFIKERESWLDEISRRQAEMVSARVTAEKLRQRDQVLATENEQLKVENACQKKRLVELEEEVNKLSGQQNLQQRIHHHAKIKEENNCLRMQNEDLANRLGRAEVLLSRVSKELAHYRAADGRPPFVNIDEEERLEKKLKEAEDERIQVARKLLSLCSSILQAAGVAHPSGEVDPAAALDALHRLHDRVSLAERELSDLRLKNKIDSEKRRMSELRSVHSPLQELAFEH